MPSSTAHLASWLPDWRHLSLGTSRKMLLLSFMVGIAGGLGAIVLFLGLEGVTHLCLNGVMGLHQPVPTGEDLHFPDLSRGIRPWAIVLLPALGGLLCGLLVTRFAPEAEGDGMTNTIHAFHHQRGKVRLRVPIVKSIASILTIGTGGSGGREGPIAQIGAGLGANLADRMKLDDRQRRTFMLAGAAAGIGAIFRAPLGGALSAVEILYREDFESPAVIPCVVSSVTAYTLFRSFLALPFIGIDAPTIFSFPDFGGPLENILFALPLGAFCAAAGILYVLLFHGLRERVFARLPLPRWLRPALGGLLVGLTALAFAKILGSGNGFLQEAITTRVAGLPRDLILRMAGGFLLFAVLKMLTTSLTVGSGGSGGVFGPTLIIGGMLGAGFGALCHALLPPDIVPPLPVFAVLGMAGFFSSVAKTPIGALIMVSELTGSYSLIAPLLVVCVIGLLLNRHHALYRSQMENRFESPAHRSLMVKDVLGQACVRDYYHPAPMPTVPKTMTAQELRSILADDQILFPLTVIDEDYLPCGMLAMGNIRPIYFSESPDALFLVADMMSPLATCTPEDDLPSVLRKFESHHASRIPVMAGDNPRHLLGYIQYQDIMHAYEEELRRLRLPG
jgi:CIC family chloride channel protein